MCELDRDTGVLCTDLNECLDQTHLCEQNCTNTAGSYICHCYTGYRLDRNNFSCIGE